MKNYLLVGLVIAGGLLISCSDDDAPAAENEEEVIDLVTLTFTPQGGGTPVVATATGPGGVNFVSTDIDLAVNTTYDLSIRVENTEEGENITTEIAEEDEEHMFFFSFTDDLFSDPAGNGNIDNRSDDVNYNDEDADGNPLGLSTTWTTGATASTGGFFRVVLKHQPGIKSTSSTATDGESDIDLRWTLTIND